MPVSGTQASSISRWCASRSRHRSSCILMAIWSGARVFIVPRPWPAASSGGSIPGHSAVPHERRTGKRSLQYRSRNPSKAVSWPAGSQKRSGPDPRGLRTTLPEPALSAHFCQPSHRAGVSALTGYDPPVRCATWHTYGPAPMRGTEPVNRRSPPPEARQRRDHQVAARRASSAFTSTSAKICQAILGGRSQCSTDPSPCRSARQLPSVPSSDRRAGPHEGAATP